VVNGGQHRQKEDHILGLKKSYRIRDRLSETLVRKKTQRGQKGLNSEILWSRDLRMVGTLVEKGRSKGHRTNKNEKRGKKTNGNKNLGERTGY